MKDKKKIACVTGASGMVGNRVVERLHLKGYHVRALSRKKHFVIKDVEMFYGGLEDQDVLKAFISDADQLYHCAAELSDESRMNKVNVQGTQKLINILKASSINYFLFLSSAGVVGLTNKKWIDESVQCNPITRYEKSKKSAERLVYKSGLRCKTIILRPTNIIDEQRFDIINIPFGRKMKDRLIIALKGGENAHLVHAEDVARASVFLGEQYSNMEPQIYFVSADHDPMNTYAGFWSIVNAINNKQSLENIKITHHLPILIPYIVRTCLRGPCNKGDIGYSSEKLISSGFKFKFNVEKMAKKVAFRIKSQAC